MVIPIVVYVLMCAYIVDEVYSIVKPSTDVHRCPILMVSTFRVGFYIAGLGRRYDFNKYDTSALLSAEALKMYKQMLPKINLKQSI